MRRFDSQDRLEAEPLDFHERVRSRFLDLAEQDAEHYLVIDATRPADRIAAEIRSRVEPLLSAARRHRAAVSKPT
jgi:dTMP kinase